MGTSTNGEISFGIPFDEGFDFPWDTEEHEHNIEVWWRVVNGYTPLLNPWTDEGDYAPGWTKDDPRFKEYFDHRNKWEAANPLPVAVVNYCSGDCPMWLIAVPGVSLTARRGYPEKFDPAQLKVSEESAAALIAFCAKWGLETSEEPAWYLTSYWG